MSFLAMMTATMITVALSLFVSGMVETERAIVKFDYPR